MEKENISYFYVVDKALIDDQTRIICTWALYTVLCQIVNIFGVLTNIINIVCFVKHGFKEPVNISLLGLAISDLGCLITQSWMNILFTPAVMTAYLSFETLDVMYLTAGIPHLTFTRVSSWITALITLERCLCIILPLKVKSIVTPKRVSVSIFCVFITMMCSGAPSFVVNKLGMKFSAQRNRTLIGLISTGSAENVEIVSFGINNCFLPFAAFAVIFICTVVLVTSLKEKTKWRNTSTAHSQTSVSSRNQKVAKMVVMISTLFILCFLPTTIYMLALVFEADLSVGGKLINVGIVAAAVGIILESVNSSVNIFIYYAMSSKYREVFNTLFVTCPSFK